MRIVMELKGKLKKTRLKINLQKKFLGIFKTKRNKHITPSTSRQVDIPTVTIEENAADTTTDVQLDHTPSLINQSYSGCYIHKRWQQTAMDDSIHQTSGLMNHSDHYRLPESTNTAYSKQETDNYYNKELLYTLGPQAFNYNTALELFLATMECRSQQQQ